MEIFNFERDMDSFLKNKIAVNCPTEEDAIHFLKILEDKYNIKWSCSGNNLSDYNNWEEYKDGTCYNKNNGLSYSSISFYDRNNYKILQYSISEETTIKQTTIEENINVKQNKKRKIFIIENF